MAHTPYHIDFTGFSPLTTLSPEEKAQRTKELGVIDQVKDIFTNKLANMKAYLKDKVEKKLH